MLMLIASLVAMEGGSTRWLVLVRIGHRKFDT